MDDKGNELSTLVSRCYLPRHFMTTAWHTSDLAGAGPIPLKQTDISCFTDALLRYHVTDSLTFAW